MRFDLRSLLLAIIVLGAVGLLVELLLLEHYDEWQQWIPLALLVAMIAAAKGLWFLPGPRTLALFRAVMWLAVVASLVGIVLHIASNRALEREMDASLRGWTLAWYSVRGATPALAPGALLQLGLIGLALAWRHPLGRNEHIRTEGAG